MPAKKYFTEEEKKEGQWVRDKKYRATAKGIATQKAYAATHRVKEEVRAKRRCNQHKYMQTENGKKIISEYYKRPVVKIRAKELRAN